MMQKGEKHKFVDLMVAAGEALRDPLGPDTIDFYWRALKDELPFDVIHQRMEIHAKTVGYRAKRFPLISEILQWPSVEEKIKVTEGFLLWSKIKIDVSTFETREVV